MNASPSSTPPKTSRKYDAAYSNEDYLEVLILFLMKILFLNKDWIIDLLAHK